jgi:hypothetical protein
VEALEASIVSYPSDEAYWEKFFHEKPWILQNVFSSPVLMISGETYVGGKMPVGRQGKGGVATDFLFADESTSSFAVAEIKVPLSGLVGSLYRGERGSGLDNETYGMHADLTGAVVQARNQIAVAVEYFESVLGPGLERQVNRLHPHGIILIGSTVELSQREKDSFNNFRTSLHNLVIITFDELLRRVQILLDGESSQRGDDEGRGSHMYEDALAILDDIPF